MNNTNIVPLTLDNFQQVIVEKSAEQLVLVAFWAEQVPESLELKGKLEAIAAARPDDFLLATVDCQAQQQIAMQFGIQGLPTAVFLKDSQPVDGIAGPQTEEALNEFLDKHLPKPEDKLAEDARVLLGEGNVKKAYTKASMAYQANNERADIKLVLADSSVQLGKVEDAKSLLASVGMVDQDSYYQSILAKVELAEEAANSPEIQQLEDQLAKEPNNRDLKHQLAAQYVQVARHEEALQILFLLVQTDLADNESKQLLLDVIKSLPDGDALAGNYRRKLYTLMY